MNVQDPSAGYASWTSPDGSEGVVYSLGVFHEIDTLVNDGYRRIPHGGIEAGGLLFGTSEGGALRIEAFRSIECQHAFGPSFVLSEGDLKGIREQLASFESDEELRGLRPLGWFIGHTRSPLQMTDREVLWFDDLFPAPDSLTVLVKPERFQPTRFGFLLRNANGHIERDASKAAVILPLSVQTASPGRKPAPSIPAPVKTEPVEIKTESLPDAPPPPPKNAPGKITRVRTEPASPPPAADPGVARPQSNTPEFPYASLASDRGGRIARRTASSFGLKSAGILVLAAVLGCLAGYWAYLQLPSPVIPVSVREQQGQIIVEWPSAQTENVDYAALQVNEGQWVSLSTDQKTSGRALVAAPPTGDVKIDLIAKHWLRDSRGIVRYIRTPKASPATSQR